MEGSEHWNEEQWEEFENNWWELIQELGDKCIELYEGDVDVEDEEEVLRSMLWKEVEEMLKRSKSRRRMGSNNKL